MSLGDLLHLGADLAGAEASPAETPREGNAERIARPVLALSEPWSLLQERTQMRDADLDLEDGKADERVAPVLACPSCGRKSSPGRARRLCCGRARNDEAAFEGT